MRKKTALLACMLLVLALPAAALGATANATIVAPNTTKITAPFAGTPMPRTMAS